MVLGVVHNYKWEDTHLKDNCKAKNLSTRNFHEQKQ